MRATVAMMPASSNRSLARGPTPDGQRARDLGTLLALLLLYFSAQLTVRLLVSDSLELDEAEQMLSTRALRVGYGAQPPLYTWLQYAFFQLFGVSVFALALLKNLLLLGTYVFTALAARRLMTPAAAVLASLSMMWLPQISWDSQRDLTHSVLATTLSAATLYLVVRLAQQPRPAGYAALGAALGLGVLAKYNYVAFAGLLGLTVLAVPVLRRRLLSPWLALSAVVAALVVAPHAWWLFENWQLASEGTMRKMAAQPGGGGSLAGWLRGMGSAALAVVAFVTPLWIVLLGFFGSRRWFGSRRSASLDATAAIADPGGSASAGAAVQPRAARRVVLTYLGLFAAMLVAMVVLGGVTHFKDRWFQPYLFAAPVAFFACFPGLAEGPRARALWRATIGFALLVLVLLAAKAPFQGVSGTPGDLNEPIGALAQAIRADGFREGVIVTDERRLAGRLRLHFPDSKIVLVGEPPMAVRDRPTLAIASDDGIGELLRQLDWPADAQAIRRVELPYRYGEHRALRARFGYVLRGPAPRP